VVDPVSVGVAVAILAGKKLVEKAGSEAGESGWGLAKRVVGRVRGWFVDTDEDAEAMLATVEDASEGTVSDEDLGALAALIDERLKAAPKIEKELASLVSLAQQDEVLAPLLSASAGGVSDARDVFILTTVGDHNIVVGKAGRDVNIGSKDKRSGPGL